MYVYRDDSRVETKERRTVSVGRGVGDSGSEE